MKKLGFWNKKKEKGDKKTDSREFTPEQLANAESPPVPSHKETRSKKDSVRETKDDLAIARKTPSKDKIVFKKKEESTGDDNSHEERISLDSGLTDKSRESKNQTTETKSNHSSSNYHAKDREVIAPPTEQIRKMDAISEANVKETLVAIQFSFSYQKTVALYDLILTHFMNLTSSSYGWIAEAKKNKSKEIFLKVRVCIEGSTHYKIHHKMDFLKESLLAPCLSDKVHVVSNSPTSDSRGKLLVLPESPSIKNLLLLPLLTGKKEKLSNVMCLANREGGYLEEHVELLRPLVKSCDNLIIAVKDRAAIKKKQVSNKEKKTPVTRHSKKLKHKS